MHFTLYQHGINAIGRRGGLSHNGPIITGRGASAHIKDEVVAPMDELVSTGRGSLRPSWSPRDRCVEVVITIETAEWPADLTRQLAQGTSNKSDRSGTR